MFSSSDTHFLFSISFNLYDILLIIIFVLSLVVALPLLLKKDRKQQDIFLALFISAQGTYALYAVMLYSQTIGQYTQTLLGPFQYSPVLLLRGCQGLLLLLFVRKMIGQSAMLKLSLVYTTAAFTLIMCIFNVVLAAFYTYNFMAFISEWSLYLVSALLSVITLRELSQYQSTLPLIYSNLRGHSLQWLKSACAVFALIWIARALAMILELAGTKQFAESIYTLSHIPILFLIGTLALYSQSHTTGFNKLFAELAKPKVGEEKNDANKLLVERMNTLMDTAKIYKDPDLRLDGFADCLDILVT